MTATTLTGDHLVCDLLPLDAVGDWSKKWKLKATSSESARQTQTAVNCELLQNNGKPFLKHCNLLTFVNWFRWSSSRANMGQMGKTNISPFDIFSSLSALKQTCYKKPFILEETSNQESLFLPRSVEIQIYPTTNWLILTTARMKL